MPSPFACSALAALVHPERLGSPHQFSLQITNTGANPPPGVLKFVVWP